MTPGAPAAVAATPSPTEAETPDTSDSQEAVAPGQQIEVRGHVGFKRGGAVLLATSKSVLDALAGTIAAHPEWGMILVGGHTSSEGKLRDNLAISAQRGKAVVDYLVKRGIAANRLTYAGYGPSQPIVKSGSRRQREKNRRVEFTRVNPENAPFGLDRVELKQSKDRIVLNVTAGRAITSRDVDVKIDGRRVLIVRIRGAQVERTWLELKHDAVLRTLLHPSGDAPPAAVIRMRLSKALAEKMLSDAVITTNGKALKVSVPGK